MSTKRRLSIVATGVVLVTILVAVVKQLGGGPIPPIVAGVLGSAAIVAVVALERRRERSS